MTRPLRRDARPVRARVSRTGHALGVVTDLDATSDPPAEPRAADGATTRAAELPDRLAYLRVIGLAALIGTPAALGAALFLALVHQVEHLLWTELPDALGASAPPWYLVIGLPVVGAAIVLAARLWLPGDGGHAPLLGVAGGSTPLRAAPGVLVAALGSLAFGAVLGPEAPLIALGSVFGLLLGRFVRLGPQEEKVVGAAGSFAAISALFGGPVVGGVFMLEGGLGLGAALIPALLPGFVAAAIGYMIFIGFGDWGGIGTQTLSVPGLPTYQGVHAVELVATVVVGVLAAAVIAAVRRAAQRVDTTALQRLGLPVLLLAGGLAVGVIAEVADLLGANSQDVLFSGQASIPALLAESSTKLVLVLLVAKAAAYAICLGCGFRGGPVFPAIFLGVALATLLMDVTDMSPTAALAVGSAAGMAAMTRMLLTSALLAALLVGSAGIDAAPIAVLASVTAWLAIAVLDPEPPPKAPVDAIEEPDPAVR
jgi:chloride channel protein, CIC family